MREMKFRAWDKFNANMITMPDNNLIQYFQHCKFYEEGGNEIIQMQFTGLLDKNGNEIYEGDIVNFAVKKKICPDCSKKDHTSDIEYGISRFCPSCGKPLSDSDFITTSKIIFYNGGFCYEYNNDGTYHQTWRVDVAAIYLAWVEIIGNVFENPELLNA